MDLSGLENGFSLLRDVDQSKLPKIISRVAQTIENNAEISDAFNADERAKLKEVLSLDEKDIDLMLLTIRRCFMYAAYHGVKPQSLAQKFGDNLSEQTADIMSKAWQKYGREITNTLKQNTLSSNRLNTIDWHLKLQVAQGSKSRIGEPNVVFQLGSGNGDNDCVIEMNHDELLDFYNKLETIQEQLDALS